MPILGSIVMRLGQHHDATRLEDLRLPPSNRLESLKDDRAGQHSVRINDQWRVGFRFRDGDAFDVKIAVSSYCTVLSPRKRKDRGLHFLVALCAPHQDADPPHPLTLRPAPESATPPRRRQQI
jgi:proteic killer suppression protein